MDWLNYHHLRYFWTVAREGGIARAADKLRLSQPTISTQVKMLEEALGERLFQRRGRSLVLTDVGRIVDRYADEIFTAGQELQETLKGRPSRGGPQLTVGVADVVPKLVVYRLLRPVTEEGVPTQIACREGQPEELIAELAIHKLDVVISDAAAPAHLRVKAFSHLLGESHHVLRGATSGKPPAAQVSPIARWRPHAAADIQYRAASSPRTVVQGRGRASAHRW